MSETTWHQHLFVVRIWQERDRQSLLSQWRGAVEHIPSGQRFYFTSLGDLGDFITLRLHSPPLVEPPADDEALALELATFY